MIITLVGAGAATIQSVPAIFKGDPGDGGSGGTVTWANVTGKPTSFTPSTHTHSIAQVTGLQTALDGKQPTTTFKTINNESIVGTGNIVVEGGTGSDVGTHKLIGPSDTVPSGWSVISTFDAGGVTLRVIAQGGVQPTSYLGVVATNLRMPTASTTSNRQFNSRSHHKARDTISALQINLPGWWWQQASGAGFTQYREHPTQGTATYRASIEYPEGTFTQITFSGSVSGTANAGQDMLSDSVAVSIPEGASFWVRVYMTSTWGMIYFAGDNNTPVGDNNYGERLEYAASGIVDKTMGGTITNTGTSIGRPQYSPIAIIAQTVKPSILLVGDSRVWGQNDTFDADGNKGELARGLGPHFGYINVGSAGDSPSDYLVSNSRRTALAQWCSHVVSQSAINALRSGSGQNKTASTVLAEQQQILALFPNKRRLTTTTMTRTSSTDSWATTANQTPIDVSARIIEYNEAIRAGVPNSIGYFDIADTLETSRNSGIWRTPGFTIDGLHASPTGYAATVAGVDVTKVSRI